MANKAEIPAKFCRDLDVICPMFSPINIALFFFYLLFNVDIQFFIYNYIALLSRY